MHSEFMSLLWCANEVSVLDVSQLKQSLATQLHKSHKNHNNYTTNTKWFLLLRKLRMCVKLTSRLQCHGRMTVGAGRNALIMRLKVLNWGRPKRSWIAVVEGDMENSKVKKWHRCEVNGKDKLVTQRRIVTILEATDCLWHWLVQVVLEKNH